MLLLGEQKKNTVTCANWDWEMNLDTSEKHKRVTKGVEKRSL